MPTLPPKYPAKTPSFYSENYFLCFIPAFGNFFRNSHEMNSLNINKYLFSTQKNWVGVESTTP